MDFSTVWNIYEECHKVWQIEIYPAEFLHVLFDVMNYCFLSRPGQILGVDFWDQNNAIQVLCSTPNCITWDIILDNIVHEEPRKQIFTMMPTSNLRDIFKNTRDWKHKVPRVFMCAELTRRWNRKLHVTEEPIGMHTALMCIMLAAGRLKVKLPEDVWDEIFSKFHPNEFAGLSFQTWSDPSVTW